MKPTDRVPIKMEELIEEDDDEETKDVLRSSRAWVKKVEVDLTELKKSGSGGNNDENKDEDSVIIIDPNASTGTKRTESELSDTVASDEPADTKLKPDKEIYFSLSGSGSGQTSGNKRTETERSDTGTTNEHADKKHKPGKEMCSSSSGCGSGGDDKAPPLKPSPRRRVVMSSSASRPLLFATRTKSNYGIFYCADGSATGPKSFTYPFDQKVKDDNDDNSIYEKVGLIGMFPRRATVDNDPILYTFTPKKSYNSSFLGGKLNRTEKKALPWHVSSLCHFV